MQRAVQGFPEGACPAWARLEYEVVNGVGMTLDRAAIVGSAKVVNLIVAIVRREPGVPGSDAMHMAPLTPARVIGFDAEKGSIEAGKDADLAIFDDDFAPWNTMISGRWG